MAAATNSAPLKFHPAARRMMDLRLVRAEARQNGRAKEEKKTIIDF